MRRLDKGTVAHPGVVDRMVGGARSSETSHSDPRYLPKRKWRMPSPNGPGFRGYGRATGHPIEHV